jgi:hypothetical protein
MSLFAELKRRHVFRMGGAYLALGWVVTQVTATVAPALGMPEWTLKLVVWLGIIGFPLIVAFAWAYELTPEGIRRESELPPSAGIHHASARRLDYITIGMIAAAVLFFVATRLLAPARESVQPATVDARIDKGVQAHRGQQSRALGCNFAGQKRQDTLRQVIRFYFLSRRQSSHFL